MLSTLSKKKKEGQEKKVFFLQWPQNQERMVGRKSSFFLSRTNNSRERSKKRRRNKSSAVSYLSNLSQGVFSSLLNCEMYLPLFVAVVVTVVVQCSHKHYHLLSINSVPFVI